VLRLKQDVRLKDDIRSRDVVWRHQCDGRVHGSGVVLKDAIRSRDVGLKPYVRSTSIPLPGVHFLTGFS
jgi:hypothetical protein